MSAAEPEWRQWLAKADNDLLNIQNNLASREIPWDTVCFHAQQAAEKMFKALIVHDGGTPNRTHDLVALLAACSASNPELRQLENDCRTLSLLATRVRYPDDFLQLNETIARDALTKSQTICNRIRGLLK